MDIRAGLGFKPVLSMFQAMTAFLIRWFVTTLAVFLTAQVVHGISYGGSMETLLAASLLLGIVNALVRPVLLLFSLPLILVTMGFFILVVNALMLELVGRLIHGFEVDGFWSAFFGSILIGIVSWILNGFFRNKDGKTRVTTHFASESGEQGAKRVSGRVIDI